MRKLVSSAVAFLVIAAGVAGASLAGVATTVAKGPVANPDAGLTDAQRFALHAANRRPTDEKLIQPPDYVGAVDRYDFELADGADWFVLVAEPS